MRRVPTTPGLRRLAASAVAVGVIGAGALGVTGSTPARAAALAGGGTGTGLSSGVDSAGTMRRTVQVGAFTISGTVSGLYPGASKSLVLHLTNLRNFPIAVMRIATVVTSNSATCPSADLSVSAFAGPLMVPAGGIGMATVSARLSHAAPNGCQGAAFKLQYFGGAAEV